MRTNISIMLSLLLVSCGASVVDISSIPQRSVPVSVDTPSSSVVYQVNFDSQTSILGAGQGISVNGSNQLVADNDGLYTSDFESLGFSTNLLAHWKLEGTAGSLVGSGNLVSDSVGLNHGSSVDIDSTLIYVNGVNTIGMDFDGSNDYISIPSSTDTAVSGDKLTLMAWLFVDAVAGNDYAVICKGPAIDNESYMLGVSGSLANTFNFRVQTSSGYVRQDVGEFQFGQWYHVVGVYNGVDMKIFVNGRFVSSTPQTGNILTTADALSIGKRCGTDNRFFNGKIDEVRVWDRDLSASEISTIYFTEKKRFTFQSDVLDGLQDVFWKGFRWETQVPWNKELPPNQLVETGFASANSNMSGNVLLYHFNEKSLPTTFADSSGVNNDAFCTSCPSVYTEGLFDSALSFNGTDQYIEANHASEYLIDQGTINLWFWARIKRKGSSQCLFSKDSSDFDNGGHVELCLINNDNEINARIQSVDTTYTYVSTTSPVKYHQWQMVTLRFGPSGMEAFVNGQSVITSFYTGGLGTSSGGTGNEEPLVIGASTDLSGDGVVTPLNKYFYGEIDEVAMWNRELSYTEIQDLYRRGANKIKFQVRACTQSDCSDDPSFVGPAGDSAAYFSELLNLTANKNSFDLSPIFTTQARYFQYSLEIEPENFADPVVIDNVYINGSESND